MEHESGGFGAKLGARIRQRRHALGLRVEDVAAKSGMSTSWVSRLEKGKENPKILDLMKVLRSMDLSLTSVVGEEPDLLRALSVQGITQDEFLVVFSRLARGMEASTPDDQKFVLQALQAFADRYGVSDDGESEADPDDDPLNGRGDGSDRRGGRMLS